MTREICSAQICQQKGPISSNPNCWNKARILGSCWPVAVSANSCAIQRRPGQSHHRNRPRSWVQRIRHELNPDEEWVEVASWTETSALSETSPSVDRFSQSSSHRWLGDRRQLGAARCEHGPRHREPPSQACSIGYHWPSLGVALPRPGADSNLALHRSSCLKTEMHSRADGAPYSGSAPPSTRACLFVSENNAEDLD